MIVFGLILLLGMFMVSCDNETTKVCPPHDWSDWNIIEPATKNTDGEKERFCKRCHEVQNEIIPAYGDNLITWEIDQNGNVDTDTTKLIFTFSSDVDLTKVISENGIDNVFVVNWKSIGQFEYDNFSSVGGSKKVWELPITVLIPGEIQVVIYVDGVDDEFKPVILYEYDDGESVDPQYRGYWIKDKYSGFHFTLTKKIFYYGTGSSGTGYYVWTEGNKLCGLYNNQPIEYGIFHDNNTFEYTDTILWTWMGMYTRQ